MEEISTEIAGPCAVRLGDMMYNDMRMMTHIDVTGCKLIADKASLLSLPENKPKQPCQSISGGNQGLHAARSCRESITSLSAHQGNRGDNGAILSNQIETEDSCISREYNHQESEEDGSISFSGDCANSCSQSVASDVSSTCVEEVSALEVNSGRNSSTTLVGERNTSDVQDVKRVAVDLVGDDGNRSDESDPKLSESSLEVAQQKKIRKTESQCLLELSNIPLWGYTCMCGRRPEMEDAVVAIPRFLQVPTQVLKVDRLSNGMNYNLSDLTAHFYGVYDGHGGCQVANYCRERMHLALAEEIELAKACELDGNIGHDWQERWKKAFSNCFIKVDAEIGGVHGGTDGDKTDHEPIAPETAGSTAVVAIISSTHIIVANCGDSRAVLYHGKLPMPLSVDHKPDREDEHARIEAAGGKVIQWKGSRVFGVLAMSRSIGDRYLKPWIIPDPEVMFVPRAKEDECLILASDGLWDVITNEEACEVARKQILLWHKKHGDKLSAERGEEVDPAAQAAAEYLSRLALSKGSKDNISVIVVDLKAQRKFKKKT
ncbi:protein phosphatase 2C 77 [Herrania umbratica]|uniref:protein-serine/threonine phosphatase n=1 Tax=Herrania umbratica TaxID=108875 RepID=A0A6J0ZLC1_9ROSI|nr:protein phosphatase 2C 77 [Herrania umbratica]XP_021275594.1 protein phosphatase 2C 77 [Herrania umbratica]XP_021275595.1 protein phosphatase 2C 77 [Herrania umbratica]XP_021275596.1 protein phosphatase 2C 77 [Herrania umbratica]XP_021275597.1 protein phosphatase 2C 77 [Herrania umbratica]